MSYIFMKILERRPGSYDAGIAKYAAGDFATVREKMLSLVKSGDRVLDVGCGPGTFAIECAKRGAKVEAVDANPQMLYTAELEAKKEGVDGNIAFRYHSATELDLDKESFDLIVFSLSLSELREVEQWIAMNSSFELLKPGGKLVVADEIVPEQLGARVLYHLRRLFLLLITYIITRSTTRPVGELEEKMKACGFRVGEAHTFEGGSLKLAVGERLECQPVPQVLSPDRLPVWIEIVGGVLSYLSLTFQGVPIRNGLYRFGNPSKESPVFVTADYFLTFLSIRRHLRKLDCYLLVIDTRGINVWCSAGKGNFSASEIFNSLRATRVGEIVESRRLILPKLSSNGVRYRDVKRLSGWDAEFGPIYARDIPEYVANGYVKSNKMKRVRFNLADRLWVSPPFAFFVGFLAFLPLIFFRNLYSPVIPLIACAVGLIFPAAFPVLPSDRFFKKALVLGIIGTAGATMFLISAGAPGKDIVLWSLIIIGMTLFVAMDFSGMSPVSNYSRIREEYYVVVPLLGIIVLSYIVLSFVWR